MRFYGFYEINIWVFPEIALPKTVVPNPALFNEHLGVDVSKMTDMDAMALFKETARGKTLRRIRGALQGPAFQLDPAHYPFMEPWLPPLDA